MSDTLHARMQEIGQNARAAASVLAMAPTVQKNAALLAMAVAIQTEQDIILRENEKDCAEMRSSRHATPALLERAVLDSVRLRAMAEGIEAIAALPDPVGTVLAEWTRPNGLHIKRIRTPLGVIGVIYESRPNVTADAGALCLKAGNAVILRGGSDVIRSSAAIHACLEKGLAAADLPVYSIQRVPFSDRAAVGEMLSGLDGNIDVIVPRGGKSLVARVQEEARVPVFAHLQGLCHVFVHAQADLEMAKKIVVNAKMRRTGICGAMETLLIDAACADTFLPPIAQALIEAGCALRGDEKTRALVPGVTPAEDSDWITEYLDSVLSIKCVEGLETAIAHINHYGSHHTDSIVTQDAAAAEKFLKEVDSAVVMHNTSTQFSDGGEFGMGAEIGIATGRMHARGPVGVEQLTSFKYIVEGTGQLRP